MKKPWGASGPSVPRHGPGAKHRLSGVAFTVLRVLAAHEHRNREPTQVNRASMPALMAHPLNCESISNWHNPVRRCCRILGLRGPSESGACRHSGPFGFVCAKAATNRLLAIIRPFVPSDRPRNPCCLRREVVAIHHARTAGSEEMDHTNGIAPGRYARARYAGRRVSGTPCRPAVGRTLMGID